MNYSYFIFANKSLPVNIERFHVCSWEFKDNSALIEFGCEIDVANIVGDEISFELFIPWLDKRSKITDLYERLKDPVNSKFIFNETVLKTEYLDCGQNKKGVIHEFAVGKKLCIMPFSTNKCLDKKTVTITINLADYQEKEKGTSLPNIYTRFFLEPPINEISIRKTGIGKSTIIYDVKINEKRNLPEFLYDYLKDKILCKISTCFCLNVVPNNFELTFLDNSTLKNVRTLEYESFNRYLEDRRVEMNELLVIFNKKSIKEKDDMQGYSFFSIFYKERIGAGQFVLAIMINIICGILLFIPAYRKNYYPEMEFLDVWNKLPLEIYISVVICIFLLLYFIWPIIIFYKNKIIKTIK